jgi:NADH-quinone oxidoreductase subunit F
MARLESIAALVEARREILKRIDPDKPVIRICMTGCRAYGAAEVLAAIKEEVIRKGLEDEVEIRETGCHGFCARAPVLAIDPHDIFYQQVAPGDAADIVGKTLISGSIIERLLFRTPGKQGRLCVHPGDIPFYKNQHRRVLANCGKIDPVNISHYLAADGYAALEKALAKMRPEDVIDEVGRAGLRGRGGAGFPTAKKWHFTRIAKGEPKYLICNADEGDPGAFMDRAILEGDPHRVLEGMLIAAYAMGASIGYIYVRAEYPIAVEHLNIAVRQAESMGLLGDNILGTDFSFHLRLKEGAGAFVCGEETALMASIEGRRGMPRPRPPFPAQSGLDGKPTCINNVETLSNLSFILSKGAEEYASLGTADSKGTKVFSLAGKVNNTGLVEVPIGTSMREMIFEIGGGIPKGRKFKSVQMGGPSGGCVTQRYLDLAIDYGSLQKIGAIMGSGGMVVMDENTCMVEIARYFVSFTQSESCGKCTPCRMGTKQMLAILTRITEGQGRESDLRTLRRIGQTVRDASLCGLGQTCPKPVLSTLEYFIDEYEAHIREKKCPAAVCSALMISPCQHTCPVGINVPLYVAAIAEGDYRKSVEIIRERNPFPSICGRICHHPCESKCRRGELDDSVAIRSLKRFAADWYFDNVQEKPEPFERIYSERVAVVGAGPSGLTCAFYLARMGYSVTVFEAMPVGGGMLSVGVPQFRLPMEVIESEIQYIADRGVEIRLNTPINRNYTIDQLREEGFDTVFIAAGTQKTQRIGIPGEVDGTSGLLYGISFLRDVKQGREVTIGPKVSVIGAGGAGVDVARTAVRLGAESVDVYERFAREQMVVEDREYEEAMEEGVRFHFLTSPGRILSERWKVTGLQSTRMKLGPTDPSGRRRPVPIEGSESTASTDTIVIAIGQAPDLSFLPADSKLERTKWETLEIDPNTLMTNIPGVFAGGDFTAGPSYVILGIAAGRRGATAIDKYLRGDKSRVDLHDLKGSRPDQDKGVEDLKVESDQRARTEMPLEKTSRRKQSFVEVEAGFSEEVARAEAARCLRCDLEK